MAGSKTFSKTLVASLAALAAVTLGASLPAAADAQVAPPSPLPPVTSRPPMQPPVVTTPPRPSPVTSPIPTPSRRPETLSATAFMAKYCDDTPIRTNVTVTAGNATMAQPCDLNIASMGVTLKFAKGANLITTAAFSLSAADNRATDAVLLMNAGSSITATKLIIHSRVFSVAIRGAALTATTDKLFVGSSGPLLIGRGANLTAIDYHVRIHGNSVVVKAGATIVARRRVKITGDRTCFVAPTALVTGSKLLLCSF